MVTWKPVAIFAVNVAYSEAIDFKIRKLAELRTDLPVHIKAPVTKTSVNELLDAHLAYMRRKNRKSTENVAWFCVRMCGLIFATV
jgi:hypothetical protein